ncbi:conserved hypothetical protein [Neospora caninum Liverpool]|uniref:Uncharacterized protein n=1 Tax=Neospora caninum (strain Liverpool) TaxID=572307 RepID=F0VHI3_NEOCL|nr:conserved hypothetical protein [Neospora caninum Liverpool]CBZ53177.1 conserved hypothetical protein [Neospora caninum Liverpool]|eukprot:XP_003883209.1 conserved hypothetical protein [Neospora caninum Liverpool]
MRSRQHDARWTNFRSQLSGWQPLRDRFCFYLASFLSILRRMFNACRRFPEDSCSERQNSGGLRARHVRTVLQDEWLPPVFDRFCVWDAFLARCRTVQVLRSFFRRTNERNRLRSPCTSRQNTVCGESRVHCWRCPWQDTDIFFSLGFCRLLRSCVLSRCMEPFSPVFFACWHPFFPPERLSSDCSVVALVLFF